VAGLAPSREEHHRDRSFPAKPLPACAVDAKGEPWSTVVSSSSDLKGKVVSVRDRLLVGPIDREHTRRSLPIVVGEGDNPLREVGSSRTPRFARSPAEISDRQQGRGATPSRVELALVHGKQEYDRRDDVRKREAQREIDRGIASRRR
jgi:hypothetical protein